MVENKCIEGYAVIGVQLGDVARESSTARHGCLLILCFCGRAATPMNKVPQDKPERGIGIQVDWEVV